MDKGHFRLSLPALIEVVGRVYSGKGCLNSWMADSQEGWASWVAQNTAFDLQMDKSELFLMSFELFLRIHCGEIFFLL